MPDLLMYQILYPSLISMADMSRTPYAIAALLVLGIVALRFLRPANSESGLWLPVAAFLAGPILALGYFAADVFLVSRNYLTTDDYIQSLIPILIIGFIGGSIGSISLWIGDKLTLNRQARLSKNPVKKAR
ncbi:hypothetical protein N9Z44_02655 [Mariniblastus sp.]|nr:hypothetical protein [Mariniblastus sp.]